MKHSEQDQPGILLTDYEVASIFRVSRATIWNWTRDRDDFPAPKRFGGATRWLVKDVYDYIEQAGANDDE